MTQTQSRSGTQSQIYSQTDSQHKGIDIGDIFDYTTKPTRICNKVPRILAETPKFYDGAFSNASNWTDTIDLFDMPLSLQNTRNCKCTPEQQEVEETIKELDESAQRQEAKLAQMENQLKILKDIITRNGILKK